MSGCVALPLARTCRLRVPELRAISTTALVSKLLGIQLFRRRGHGAGVVRQMYDWVVGEAHGREHLQPACAIRARAVVAYRASRKVRSLPALHVEPESIAQRHRRGIAYHEPPTLLDVNIAARSGLQVPPAHHLLLTSYFCGG